MKSSKYFHYFQIFSVSIINVLVKFYAYGFLCFHSDFPFCKVSTCMQDPEFCRFVLKLYSLLNPLIHFSELDGAKFILSLCVLSGLLLIAKCAFLQQASHSSSIHLQYLILTTHSSSYWPRVKIDTLIWRTVPLSIFKPDQSLYLI